MISYKKFNKKEKTKTLTERHVDHDALWMDVTGHPDDARAMM